MSLSRLTNPSDDLPDPGGRPAVVVPTETSFLDDCSREDWERIGRYCVQQRFLPGEEIARQGEVDRSLAIILSGSLDVVVESGVAERSVAVIEAPSVVGEVAFFDAAPRSATLRARTAGELLRLSFSDFEALAAASPSLARTMLLDAGRIVALRLRRTTQLLLEATSTR
jgi:CRP/FNR family transcriptional regulator, cyclic AMP receptor protein